MSIPSAMARNIRYNQSGNGIKRCVSFREYVTIWDGFESIHEEVIKDDPYEHYQNQMEIQPNYKPTPANTADKTSVGVEPMQVD